MAYNLAALIRRAKNPRRAHIVVRDIRPPQMFAMDLYRRTYARVCDAWAEAVPRILAEYERSLPVLDTVTDAASDMGDLFDDVAGGISRLTTSVTPDMRTWVTRVEKWHRGEWTAAVKSAAGVDIETIMLASGTPTSVGATLAWNASLIRDVSDQARQKISAAVFAGLQQRKPARDVAKEIEGIVAMSRRRSTLIASDQLAKLASGLDSERMHEAGIDRFKYRHSGKVHARKWHQHRNGKFYALASGEQINGSDQIKADDMPGMPPWCGCRKQAVVSIDDSEPLPAPSPPPPPAPPPAAGFRSPVDPRVTDGTVTVRPRLALQREMRQDLEKAARHRAYDPQAEYKDRAAADFGRANFTPSFDDEAVSVIAAIKPELDSLADMAGIPRLRGIKTTTTAIASKGDGVLAVNADYFNLYANRVGEAAGGSIAEIEAQRATLAAQMGPLAEQINAIRARMNALDGGARNPEWHKLFEEQEALFTQHAKLRTKDNALWRKLKSAKTAAASEKPVAQWKPGNDVAARPFNTVSYFEGIDRARAVLFHEFAHHIHQYFRREGPRRLHGKPPLELTLPNHFRRATVDRADRQPSKYALTNEKEWFAENFAVYALGRKDLVDPEAIKVIEAIFDGSY